jgi:hypothetical protein
VTVSESIRLALRGSAMLEVCLGVYVDHHDNGTGMCVMCRVPVDRCVPRANSAKVMTAAGLDPARFDTTAMFEQSAYVRPAYGWGGR